MHYQAVWIGVKLTTPRKNIRSIKAIHFNLMKSIIIMSTSSFLPPPGTNWIEALRPAVTFMLIGATMGSVMVVMLLALLFFSTPSLRKTPIFLLNVVVILLGLCGAIINIYEEVGSFWFTFQKDFNSYALCRFVPCYILISEKILQ